MTDVTADVIAGVSGAIALLAYFKSRSSDSFARNANQISVEANKLAKEANDQAEDFFRKSGGHIEVSLSADDAVFGEPTFAVIHAHLRQRLSNTAPS
jgi:hypothetical protein